MRPPISNWLLNIVYGPAAILGATVVIGGCDYNAAPPTTPGAPTTAPAASTTQSIGIDNFSFDPPTLTVPAGATVTWVNHDDVPHTVTANDKAFGSKALDTDDRYAHVFTVPGTYPYFCAVHPHMTGQIIVK